MPKWNFVLLLLLVGSVSSTLADDFSINLCHKARIAVAGQATLERCDDQTMIFSVEAGNGWPQLNIDQLPTTPAGATDLRLVLERLEPAVQNFGIGFGSVPGSKLAERYITAELKAPGKHELLFRIQDPTLNAVRLFCKNPTSPGKYRIEGLYYDKARTLADGWSFESAADSGRFAGHAEISGEYAFRGKKSLKLDLPSGQEVATIYPDITDWKPFKQLRFVIYNPKPQPHEKYRMFSINGKYMPENCSIASGLLQVAPETAREFVLDLDTLPKDLDRGNIDRIQIFKGSPETVFFLDEIKLYTPEEVEALTTGKARAEARRQLERIAKLESDIAPGLRSPLQSVKTRLEAYCESGKLAEKTLGILIREAQELTTLAAAAKQIHAQGDLALTGVPPTEKVFRDTDFSGRNTFRITAAGNERESFQVVALPLRPLTGVQAAASPLRSASGQTIGPEHIQINPVGYIELTVSYQYPSSRVGFWPDILVNNQPLNLAHRIQPYWITVYVPSHQAPGEYQGSIDFSSAEGGRQSYAYTVTVRNFSLPVRGKCLTFFDWRHTPGDPVIRRKCYDAMLDCRLNPTGMYINGNSPDGDKTPYQFSPHPDDLEHCLARGMNLFAIWFLYDGANPKNPHQFTPEYLEKFTKFIRYYYPILQSKGAEQFAVVNGFDEIMHQDRAEVERRLAEARKLCGWIKRDFPGIKISNVGNKMEIPTNLMDIWFLGIRPRAETKDITDRGGIVCFYSVYGNPSPMLDLPGMAGRILAWQAFKEGAGGIGYYSTYRPWALCDPQSAPTGVDWPKEKINALTTNRPGRNGDGNLFYPARDGSVLSSIRIHNIRDGVEDYEYMAMLAERAPHHKLLQIPDEIVTIDTDGYTKDYELLSNYRVQLADAIEAAASAAPPLPAGRLRSMESAQ